MTIAKQESLWEGSQFVGKLQDKLIYMLERSEPAQRSQVEAIYVFYVEFEGLGKVLTEVIKKADPEIFHDWFVGTATKPETIRRELQFVQNELRPDLLPDDVREERAKKQAAVRAMRKAAKSRAR